MKMFVAKNFSKILLLTLLLFTLSCRKKNLHVTCGTEDLNNRTNIESRVIYFKKVALIDTNLSLLQGVVMGKDSSDKISEIETLPFATVTAMDKKGNIICGVNADYDGNFKMYLQPSLYTFTFNFVGYNRITIKNVELGVGEVFNCKILLGQMGKDSKENIYTLPLDNEKK